MAERRTHNANGRLAGSEIRVTAGRGALIITGKSSEE
jgi:hypothetical protein